MKSIETNKELSTEEEFAKIDCEYYVRIFNNFGYDCTLYCKEEKTCNTISFYFNDKPLYFTATYQEMATFLSGLNAGLNLAKYYNYEGV
ncbi:MAG: hypothetical protein J6S67_19020 [Methanobrevibacter sp.]|nr:hypothetical protein [Methanobrevibacter sp.]